MANFKQTEEKQDRNKRRQLSALVSFSLLLLFLLLLLVSLSLLISCALLAADPPHRAANYPRLPPNSPSNHLIRPRFLITQPGMLQLQFFISIMAEITVRNKIRHLNKWITWEASYGTGLRFRNAHWKGETVQCVCNAALANVKEESILLVEDSLLLVPSFQGHLPPGQVPQHTLK